MPAITETYDVGDLTRQGNHSGNTATAAFTNSSGVATDPTTVTLRVEKPDGSTTTYTYGGSPALLKETTGRYYVDVTRDQAGVWSWELKGTGAVVTMYQWADFVRSNLVG